MKHPVNRWSESSFRSSQSAHATVTAGPGLDLNTVVLILPWDHHCLLLRAPKVMGKNIKVSMTPKKSTLVLEFFPPYVIGT
jgi:hypothetical protein